jgi:hypothetical protein
MPNSKEKKKICIDYNFIHSLLLTKTPKNSVFEFKGYANITINNRKILVKKFIDQAIQKTKKKSRQRHAHKEAVPFTEKCVSVKI